MPKHFIAAQVAMARGIMESLSARYPALVPTSYAEDLSLLILDINDSGEDD